MNEDRTYEQAVQEKLDKYKPLIVAIEVVAHCRGISKKDALDWIFQILEEGKSIRLETREVKDDLG